MKNTFMLLPAMLLVIAPAVVRGQRQFGIEERETIRQTLEFAPGAGAKVFELHNIHGAIRVTGYDGRNVEMVAEKTIRGNTQDDVLAARKDVTLDVSDKADTIRVRVDYPESDSRRSAGTSFPFQRYQVAFDFEIRLPRDTAVLLRSINGNVLVRNVAGDFDVNDINGNIELLDAAGSGRARTINGTVKAAFAGNPKSNSHFGSLNGDVEVTFQRNLSANLRFKSFRGGVYTDFPASIVPPANSMQRIGGSGFQEVRVGNGGPTLEFDGFNGDVRILEAK